MTGGTPILGHLQILGNEMTIFEVPTHVGSHDHENMECPDLQPKDAWTFDETGDFNETCASFAGSLNVDSKPHRNHQSIF